jgi:hypothetical protein
VAGQGRLSWLLPTPRFDDWGSQNQQHGHPRPIRIPPARALFGRCRYFSPNGAADLSVTISSAVLQKPPAGGQRLSVGIGGAITADSDPDEELSEIHTKATAILGVFAATFPVSAYAEPARATAQP